MDVFGSIGKKLKLDTPTTGHERFKEVDAYLDNIFKERLTEDFFGKPERTAKFDYKTGIISITFNIEFE